jgi:uncharacterized protein
MAARQATIDDARLNEVEVTVVDCDVHVAPRELDELFAHMPEPWRSRLGTRRRSSAREIYTPYWNPRRLDSLGPGGTPAGSEPDLLHRQLLEDAGVDFALLLPLVGFTVDPDLNAAVCRAHNAWLAATWLDEWSAGGRLFGSINVPLDNAPDAVTEIDEWAGNPAFKQVLVAHHSERALGFPEYEPIWEAAARHSLPVAIHVTSHAAEALGATPVGRFQHYVDYHAIAYPLTYSAQLVSLLCSGVFDRLPALRFVFVEGGFLWHRPVLTRLARHWEVLRSEVAAVRSDPLEYVRDHVRFTSQPIEESDEPRDVARLLELAEADRLLMFSSDYPHYDYDDPKRALPTGLPKDVRARVMHESARELYELPRTRPVSPRLDGSEHS